MSKIITHYPDRTTRFVLVRIYRIIKLTTHHTYYYSVLCPEKINV